MRMLNQCSEFNGIWKYAGGCPAQQPKSLFRCMGSVWYDAVANKTSCGRKRG